MDIDFMPNQTAHLISISGHSTVGLWDVEKGIAILQFVGHEGSVRALSVCNDSPGMIVSLLHLVYICFVSEVV
ncbi:unnamed protein product [Anisakis simplex]|uniref:Uncharacterized protein n=1 Tax=Anisakis simplex TaxID=6269 RepID=A0A3P6P733_ANISI|nr:unnamed protein product [Anisakis simplex]